MEKAIIVDISPVARTDKKSSMATLGSSVAALQQLNLDDSVSLSVGRRQANELLTKAFPDKATRDFILLNLQKADNGL